MARAAARLGAAVVAVVVGCGGAVTEDRGSGVEEGTGGEIGNGGGGSIGGGSGGFGTGGSCFAAGTRIATPRGDVPIESLREGDLVLGYDEASRTVVEERVRTTFVHVDQPVGRIQLGNDRELRITNEHPVYLPDTRRYVPAGQLAGDERLLVLGEGRGTTSAISSGFAGDSLGTETVYNIEVDRVHNYFAEGVLVHNKGAGGGPFVMGGVHLGTCAPSGACADPGSPTEEHVPLPSEVGPQAPSTSDAGAPARDAGAGALPGDAGAPNADAAPGEAAQQMTVQQCASSASDTFLAFDVMSPRTDPMFSVFATNESCHGGLLGEVHFDVGDVQPRDRWYSQCVLLSGRLGSHYSPPDAYSRITVEAEPGTLVGNIRFVTRCECARELMPREDRGTGWVSRCAP